MDLGAGSQLDELAALPRARPRGLEPLQPDFVNPMRTSPACRRGAADISDSVALPNVARSPIFGLLMHFVYADSDGAAVTRTDARRTPTVLSEG